MYSVSALYEQYLAAASRQYDLKVVIGAITYTNNSVIEFSINDSIASSDDFTLGAVIASTLTLSLLTTDTIPSNAKVTPYIRLNGANGYTEWLPLGVFYIDERKLSNGVWTFSCIDKLIYGQQIYYTTITLPATMQEILNDVCTKIGIMLDPSIIINTNYTITAYEEGTTMRDMLSYIAAAHGSNIKLGKDEKLKFIKAIAPTSLTPIDASQYISTSKTNSVKSYTKLLCVYNKAGDMYYAGDVNADSSTTLTFKCLFATQEIVDSIFLALGSFSYTPFTMDWRGLPQMDVGDAVQITLRDGTQFNSLLLNNKVSYKGGLRTTSIASSLSPTKSEFAFKGSIAAQLVEIKKTVAASDPAKIKTDYEKAIQDATSLITGSKGGNVVMRADATGKPSEILIMDTDDVVTAQNVWRWNLGGFGHSSTGVNGPYSTAITQDGHIVASFITALTVNAENILAGQISGSTFKTIATDAKGNHIKIHQQYIDFVTNDGGANDQDVSVFQLGINMPGAEAGKPQLFFGNGCSLDTFDGVARYRKDAKNYSAMNTKEFSIYMTDPSDETKSKQMFYVSDTGVYFNGKKLGEGEGGVEYPHAEINQIINYVSLKLKEVGTAVSCSFTRIGYDTSFIVSDRSNYDNNNITTIIDLGLHNVNTFTTNMAQSILGAGVLSSAPLLDSTYINNTESVVVM